MKNLRYLFFCMLAGFLCHTAYAQQVLFEKTFGGAYEDGAGFNAVVNFNDTAYILGGDIRYSNGMTDAYIVVCDTNGNETTHYIWGGSSYDMAYDLIKTSDNNLLFAGRTWSYGAGWFDGWAYKFTPNGTMLWSKTYGGTGKEHFYRVAETPYDSGFVYTGGNNYDYFWIVKADKNGNQLWEKSFGLGSGTDVCSFPDRTIIVGATRSYGPNPSTVNVYLVALTPAGDTLYTRYWGGNQEDAVYGICPTPDNGYIVTGHTMSMGAGGADILLQKYSLDGTLLWTKTYGGTGNEYSYKLEPTSDNCYLVAGNTSSIGAGSGDVWLLKIDQNGDTIWTATYGGPQNEIGMYAEQLQGGCYLISGITSSYGAGSSDHYLIKIRDNGIVPVELTSFTAQTVDNAVLLEWVTATELNNSRFEVQRKEQSEFNWQTITSIPGAGTVSEVRKYSYVDKSVTSGNYIYRLKQIDHDGSFTYSAEVTASVGLVPQTIELLQNYPNPFNPVTYIKFSVPERMYITLDIFDVLGNKIDGGIQGIYDSGNHQVEFKAAGIGSGIYYCRLKAGSYTGFIKMVYIK